MEKGHIPGNKGKITTTEPLKSLEDVAKVRHAIQDDPRSLALFSLGVNSALRASDMLNLKRDDLKGNQLLLREKKTGKLRHLVINAPTLAAINAYLATRKDDLEWLFAGQRGKLTHGYLGALTKSWFKKAGIEAERIACHSLRKTFVRINHSEFGVPLSTMMHTLNHSSERQTLQYCGLLGEDVAAVYANVI